MTTKVKDPDSTVDWQVGWGAWLAQGESIASTQTLVNPPGLTVTQTTHTADTVTIWTAGGVDGATHTVTSRVTTNQGRTGDWSFRLAIRHT